MKKEIIIKILYACSVIGFLTYLSTKNSLFMFLGGLLLTVASIMSILNNKK